MFVKRSVRILLSPVFAGRKIVGFARFGLELLLSIGFKKNKGIA